MSEARHHISIMTQGRFLLLGLSFWGLNSVLPAPMIHREPDHSSVPRALALLLPISTMGSEESTGLAE